MAKLRKYSNTRASHKNLVCLQNRVSRLNTYMAMLGVSGSSILSEQRLPSNALCDTWRQRTRTNYYYAVSVVTAGAYSTLQIGIYSRPFG